MSSSISYDGGDYTDLGSINPLSGTSELTLACWINPDDLGAGYFYGRNYDTSFSFGFDGGATKHVETIITGTGGHFIRQTDATTATLFTTGTWYHVAFTWDYNGGTPAFAFYIDGVSKANSYRVYSDVVSAMGTGTGTLGIGDTPLGSSWDWNGDMAYLQIFDRALSQAEVQEIMYKPGSIMTNCQGYWDLLTLTPPDQSGNGNDGTNNGATAGGDGPPVYFPGGQ